MTKLNKMNAIELEELKSYYYDNYSYDDLLMLTLQEGDKVDELMEELQKKDNIINAIKEELNKNYNTYVCKNKSYGKIFKAGAEIYKEHLLYKIKELEGKDE